MVKTFFLFSLLNISPFLKNASAHMSFEDNACKQISFYSANILTYGLLGGTLLNSLDQYVKLDVEMPAFIGAVGAAFYGSMISLFHDTIVGISRNNDDFLKNPAKIMTFTMAPGSLASWLFCGDS